MGSFDSGSGHHDPPRIFPLNPIKAHKTRVCGASILRRFRL